MDYLQVLTKVALKYNSTPEEVEKEIIKALEFAGLDIPPQLFIALCVNKINNQDID
ncbi:MAG: hypothetical protein J5964_03655 [Eubacterium sp.]|nr:hypothetical protein [Eubacterium sp.]